VDEYCFSNTSVTFAIDGYGHYARTISMARTKELGWKDLTVEEQAVVVSRAVLTNPEDFSYQRVSGALFAVDEDHTYQATLPPEFSDEYEDDDDCWFGVDGTEEVIITRGCLIPITTDRELAEEIVCKEYLGVDPAHITNFTVGF